MANVADTSFSGRIVILITLIFSSSDNGKALFLDNEFGIAHNGGLRSNLKDLPSQKIYTTYSVLTPYQRWSKWHSVLVLSPLNKHIAEVYSSHTVFLNQGLERKGRLPFL